MGDHDTRPLSGGLINARCAVRDRPRIRVVPLQVRVPGLGTSPTKLEMPSVPPPPAGRRCRGASTLQTFQCRSCHTCWRNGNGRAPARAVPQRWTGGCRTVRRAAQPRVTPWSTSHFWYSGDGQAAPVEDRVVGDIGLPLPTASKWDVRARRRPSPMRRGEGDLDPPDAGL